MGSVIHRSGGWDLAFMGVTVAVLTVSRHGVKTYF